MAEILVTDLPEHVVSGIDASAQRLGLSRNEFLLSVLCRVAQDQAPVTTADFQDLSATFSDLLNEGDMKDAWS
jgi:hypothetical protein